MTCIVGLIHGGRAFLGGDSAGVGGYTLTVRADQKVFRLGEFVIGFTTSFRMGQILRYSFHPPEIEGWDLWRYMSTSFIDAARAAFKQGGYSLKASSGQEEGGRFLVGVRGHLFRIDDDFQVGVSADQFDAVGCGDDVARGSLFTSAGDPEQRVYTALMAAERFSAGVRGPFALVSTDGESP